MKSHKFKILILLDKILLRGKEKKRYKDIKEVISTAGRDTTGNVTFERW